MSRKKIFISIHHLRVWLSLLIVRFSCVSRPYVDFIDKGTAFITGPACALRRYSVGFADKYEDSMELMGTGQEACPHFI